MGVSMYVTSGTLCVYVTSVPLCVYVTSVPLFMRHQCLCVCDINASVYGTRVCDISASVRECDISASVYVTSVPLCM